MSTTAHTRRIIPAVIIAAAILAPAAHAGTDTRRAMQHPISNASTCVAQSVTWQASDKWHRNHAAQQLSRCLKYGHR